MIQDTITSLQNVAAIGFNGNGFQMVCLSPVSRSCIRCAHSASRLRDIDLSPWTGVTTLQLSKDCSLLASGETGSISVVAEILVWDFASGTLQHRLSLHKSSISAIAFSPSGRYLASMGVRDDNQLVVWDVVSGKAICSSSAHSVVVNACLFLNRSDTSIVTAGVNHVNLWTLNEGTRKLSKEPIVMGSLKRVFTTIAIAPDDSLAYCGSTTGDVVELCLKNKLQKRIGPVKTLFPGGVSVCTLIPQGDLLVGTGQGHIAKIALSSLRLIAQSSTPMAGGCVTSLALTPDGSRFFAGLEESSIHFGNTETLDHELRATCHTHSVAAIAFPSNSSDVFATAAGSELRVWSTKSKQELLRIQVPSIDCFCLEFAGDGKSILSGWSDGKLRAFTPQTGQLIYAISDAHKDGASAVRVFRDCARLISGGSNGEIRIWKVNKSHQELVCSLKEHKARVNGLVLRTDDEARAVSASADGSCIVWDLVKRTRLVCMFETTLFRSVVYHPEFGQIVTVGSDRRLTYWDVFDGQALRVLESANPDDGDACVVVAKSGSHIVVAGSDKVVNVYDYDLGRIVAVGSGGHSTPITSLAISPDQEFVISGGSDGSILFWQLNGELVETFSRPLPPL